MGATQRTKHSNKKKKKKKKGQAGRQCHPVTRAAHRLAVAPPMPGEPCHPHPPLALPGSNEPAPRSPTRTRRRRQLVVAGGAVDEADSRRPPRPRQRFSPSWKRDRQRGSRRVHSRLGTRPVIIRRKQEIDSQETPFNSPVTPLRAPPVDCSPPTRRIDGVRFFLKYNLVLCF